jgi:hypothetical protein
MRGIEMTEPISTMTDSRLLPDGGTLMVETRSWYVPPASPTKVYAGVDCPVKDLDDTADRFVSWRYTRDFGIGSGDNTLLAVTGTRIEAARISGAIVHYSCKRVDTDNVNAWLEELPNNVANVEDGCMVSFHHEPFDNAATMAPEFFRHEQSRLFDLIDAHPNGDLVKWRGPVLSTWHVTHPTAGFEPEAYLDPRSNFFGADRYTGPWFAGNPGYPSAEWTFKPAVDIARRMGLRLVIGEWGSERRTDDFLGAGRAAYIDACGFYLAEIPELLGIGWWQKGGCRIEANTMEDDAMNLLLARLNGE